MTRYTGSVLDLRRWTHPAGRAEAEAAALVDGGAAFLGTAGGDGFNAAVKVRHHGGLELGNGVTREFSPSSRGMLFTRSLEEAESESSSDGSITTQMKIR